MQIYMSTHIHAYIYMHVLCTHTGTHIWRELHKKIYAYAYIYLSLSLSLSLPLSLSVSLCLSLSLSVHAWVVSSRWAISMSPSRRIHTECSRYPWPEESSTQTVPLVAEPPNLDHPEGPNDPYTGFMVHIYLIGIKVGYRIWPQF